MDKEGLVSFMVEDECVCDQALSFMEKSLVTTACACANPTMKIWYLIPRPSLSWRRPGYGVPDFHVIIGRSVFGGGGGAPKLSSQLV